MQALVNGQWREATPIGYGVDGELVPVTVFGGTPVPDDRVTVQLTTADTAAFEPWVTVWPGGAVEWLANGSVVSTAHMPSLSGYTSYTLRAESSAVRYLNLGFNHNDDAGRDNLGAAHDWPATNVVGVGGLNELTALEAFMAASTPLTGSLDCSGMVDLQYIECFSAYVQSVDLTGCLSLIRLCLEHCSLNSIDLNPVRTTLRDLRCAEQRAGALTFETMVGSLPELWHYCTRDTLVYNHVPLSLMPAIVQWWPWNTGMETMDGPVSPDLNSVVCYQNDLDSESVDAILAGLVAYTAGGGYLDLTGSAAPSGDGLGAASTLISRGWSVAVA